MKLTLTKKYFPRTLALIQKLPTKDINKLIQKYSLDGIKLFSPKKNKVVTAVPNDVNSSDVATKIVSAVKLFDDRITAKDPVTIFFRDNSALVDHDVYDKLADYISNHYPDIPKGMGKYLKKDDMVADQLKSGKLKGFLIKAHGYTAINLYNSRDFTFSISQLTDIATAYYDGDKKFISKHMTRSVVQALHDDGVKFNKLVAPMLYLLMKNPTEYRKALLHERLFMLISTYIRI